VAGSIRSRSIDVLRAVAVLLVMQHHFGVHRVLYENGWMGVDLFFVLSGYLVSGLLFDELARSGDVRPGRFLVRRAFKIYPAFWVLIALTVALAPTVSKKALLCELAFVQNYGPGLYPHTWSLAVEEHFYLLVALAFARRRWFARLATPSAGLLAFGAGLLAILALRIATVALVPARYKLVTLGTHVRADALLFGVAIAWARREATLGPWLRRLVAGRRAWLALTAMLLLVPIGVLGKAHWFTETIGFTLVYLAAGLLLLVALDREPGDPISRALAYLGRSSYSIYLWHIPVQALLLDRLAAAGLLPAPLATNRAFVMLGGVVAGILSARLVEDPLLRVRERLLRTAAR